MKDLEELISCYLRTISDASGAEPVFSEFAEYMAAFEIIDSLRQEFHPFLWKLLESPNPPTVRAAAAAIATALRGSATHQDVERVMTHLDRVDTGDADCDQEERMFIEKQMLEGRTLGDLLSQRNRA